MTLQSSAFRFFRYNRLDNCRGGGTADLPFEISLTRSRVEKRRMNLHTRTVMIDYARLLLLEERAHLARARAFRGKFMRNERVVGAIFGGKLQVSIPPTCPVVLDTRD